MSTNTNKLQTYTVSSTLTSDQVRDTLTLLNRVEIDGSRSHEHAALKMKLARAEQGEDVSVSQDDVETLFSFLAKARLTGAEAGRFVNLCRLWQTLVTPVADTPPETPPQKRPRKKRASR